MELIYSDLCLLGGDPVENAGRLSSLGAGGVELIMDGGGWDDFRGRSGELVRALRDCGLSYMLHSPCWDLNLSSENDRIREASLAASLDAIDFAAQLGCHHLVVHTGFCQTSRFDKERAKARNREALGRLAERAEALGVRLGVENVGYHGTSLFTQEEFSCLLEEWPEARYLIDTGHAALNGWDIPGLIRRLSGRICGLHLHDNDGVADLHLPLGEGVIPWEPILDAMTELPSDCNMVLEYNFDVPLETLQTTGSLLRRRLARGV